MILKQWHPQNYLFSFQFSINSKDGYSYSLNHGQLHSLLHKSIHVQVTWPLYNRLGWFPQQETPIFPQQPSTYSHYQYNPHVHVFLLWCHQILFSIPILWKTCIRMYLHCNIYIYTHTLIKYSGKYLLLISNHDSIIVSSSQLFD